MKLASLKGPTRDGTLCVVSRDLARAVKVDGIAPTMQWALENWEAVQPRLRQAAQGLEGAQRHAFDFQAALERLEVDAPLPRAYEWLDGSAYLTHVERVPAVSQSPLFLEALASTVQDHLTRVGALGFVG